jgi:hypothetical protein
MFDGEFASRLTLVAMLIFGGLVLKGGGEMLAAEVLFCAFHGVWQLTF